MALLVFLGFCRAAAVISSRRRDLQTLGLSSASLNLSIWRRRNTPSSRKSWSMEPGKSMSSDSGPASILVAQVEWSADERVLQDQVSARPEQQRQGTNLSTPHSGHACGIGLQGFGLKEAPHEVRTVD